MKNLKLLYRSVVVLVVVLAGIGVYHFIRPSTSLPSSLYFPATTWNKYPKISTVPTGPFVQTTQPATAQEGYSFFATVGKGVPVRWNPCIPIDYQVNPDNLPPNALKMLKITFKDIHAATGITFIFAGTTRAIPLVTPSPTTRSPIVIGWRYLKNSIGDGLPTIIDSNGSYQIVGGSAVFSKNIWPTLNIQQQYSLLHHELGHVLGLFHVDSPNEVMNPIDNTNAPATYGHGDLKGLAYLGLNEGCLPQE
jgi:hypothetical protein